MKNFRPYEFLVILPPPHDVTTDARKFILQGKSEHGWPTWSTPHFTVCNVIQPANNESRIKNALERLATSTMPFYMDLSGFGYFAGPTHTIYINPLATEKFKILAKETKESIRKILIPQKAFRSTFTMNPHLTLAKHLSEEDFKQAWPKWMNRPYNAKCDIERILILKRELSPIPKKYEEIGNFPFLGDGDLNHQLVLF